MGSGEGDIELEGVAEGVAEGEEVEEAAAAVWEGLSDTAREGEALMGEGFGLPWSGEEEGVGPPSGSEEGDSAEGKEEGEGEGDGEGEGEEEGEEEEEGEGATAVDGLGLGEGVGDGFSGTQGMEAAKAVTVIANQRRMQNESRIPRTCQET